MVINAMHTLFHCGLSLMIGLASLSPAAAMSFATHPIMFPQSGNHIFWVAQGVMQSETSPQSGSLPDSIQQAVLQDLAQQTGDAPDQFQIIQAQAQTWPDGCLGLATPDVFCTMALVEGWQVQVSNGSQTWTYRTDAFGDVVKLEPATASSPKNNSQNR
ncbi:conserved hypothetical protein [Acaryochloris marina MBIC11017]|uniref:Uncharacterized protein n=2 Tax=Acaryochloris marina TaxID=155978 RepID=B0BYQ7_ACAM1|nr:conserved hypothetical protein [Acaryochloris marina MBIC11017]BDM81837.1 hypothetical protein AM10699_47020 [Acaryochloris marina MBIC10699]